MGVFSDIELEWGDRIYTIQPRRVMRAIAIIEEHVTLQELARYGASETVPLAKLCMAYGAVLRYAGAKVDDCDIYALMFRDADSQQVVANAITLLVQMMLPAEARAGFLGGGDDQAGDDQAGAEAGGLGETPAAAVNASSKRRSKPRSRRAGG